MNQTEPAWVKAHAEALRKGELSYLDPETGYQVFSALGLKKRGKCCGSGCRHCPYDHVGVPANRRVRPSFLTDQRPERDLLNVLFWSGGKDSFLALCSLIKSSAPDFPNVVLLTTYDPFVDLIAHQEIRIRDVIAQAEILELPLLGVPLVPGEKYTAQIEHALRFLEQHAPRISSLAFGDLHLQHVLDWRTQNLAPLATARGANLKYPVLNTPYPMLFDLFEKSEASAKISATTVENVSIGQNFTRKFARSLPSPIDQFGEHGEFHTLVAPKGSARDLKARLQK